MTNDITISGNLTKEPQQRFTPNGKSVVEFTLAHNTRQYNQQSQQWEDGEPTFIDVTFGAKRARTSSRTTPKTANAPWLCLAP